jgi:hypothetical protein
VLARGIDVKFSGGLRRAYWQNRYATLKRVFHENVLSQRVAQPHRPPAAMILYVSALTPHQSNLYRMWALERLGERVRALDVLDFNARNPLLQKVMFRLSAGPGVIRLNREILRLAEREKPEILWADKVLWLWPSTLRRLRQMGIVTVGYNPDNPFGTRSDPGWRLFLKSIPHFDLNVVPRERNIAEYRQHGARDVMSVQFAYEPTVQFPPPASWTDRARDRGVSFIGSPYDDRAAIFTRLAQAGLPIVVSGSEAMWSRALEPDVKARIFREGELSGEKYREGIWRSKINLSFVTKSNADEFAHKSFEIAACGGFLLAERSAGHTARFVEDEEAVFFGNEAELQAKIRQYLPAEAARRRIAAAGHARAARSGYDNDTQVGLILERAKQIARSRS